jgi:hypothetical protein
MLSKCLPDVTRKYGMDKKRGIYQYDNDPKHKAKSIQKWLTEQGYKIMEWLSQSPNLNTIGNLWATLKRRVYTCKPPPKDLGELQACMGRAWKTISSDGRTTLMTVIHDRVRKVRKAKGYWMHY